MILEALSRNTENARAVIRKAVPVIAGMTRFSTQGALQTAIVTSPGMIPEHKKRELEPIIGKYIV